MIITRFAPSPTGHLHLGNLRSCFLNWIFAKKNKGKFILRFDDTDKERSKEEFVASINSDLQWLKIDYQETFFQSKRVDRYDELFDKLIEKNLVYPCFESNEELEIKKKLQLKAGKPPIYDRQSLNLSKEEIEKKIINGEKPYWRFKLSQQKIIWNDLVKSNTEVDLSSQSDPVLRRADGSYLYHFPSVVDDIDMKISHIIRGEDHLFNSAVHSEIFQSLGSGTPAFGHNPLMLNHDGTKISKRNIDSISINQFRGKGYSTNSILSYMYSVGLNSDFDFQNIASDEFNDFDLSKISKNLPKLDIKKIDYFQKNSLRLMTNSGLSDEFPELSQLEITNKEWDLIKNNIDNYEDINEFLDIIRRKKIENKPAKEFVDILVSNIEKIKTMNFDGYINFLTNHELKLSKKDIFTNTRYILTGNKNGPSVKDLFLFFGAEGIEKIINEFETF